MKHITHLQIDSPVGPLWLAAETEGLSHLLFVRDTQPLPLGDGSSAGAQHIERALTQLQEYFAQGRREFQLALSPAGTDFQKQVWGGLCEIPYAETISYRQLAERIARPKAVRAVGAANGKNPISIIVPCHRVIGADGSLTGYGGGLPAKKILLELEGWRPAASPSAGQLSFPT